MTAWIQIWFYFTIKHIVDDWQELFKRTPYHANLTIVEGNDCRMPKYRMNNNKVLYNHADKPDYYESLLPCIHHLGPSWEKIFHAEEAVSHARIVTIMHAYMYMLGTCSNKVYNIGHVMRIDLAIPKSQSDQQSISSRTNKIKYIILNWSNGFQQHKQNQT